MFFTLLACSLESSFKCRILVPLKLRTRRTTTWYRACNEKSPSEDKTHIRLEKLIKYENTHMLQHIQIKYLGRKNSYFVMCLWLKKKTHAHICFFFFFWEMAHAHIWWNFINIKKKNPLCKIICILGAHQN